MPVLHDSEEWRELIRKVDQLSSDFGHNQQVQTERHESNVERISAVEEAINGNGKPGLKADVRDILTGIRLIKWLIMLAIALLGLWFTHLEITRKISVNTPTLGVKSTQQSAGDPVAEVHPHAK